ncbi:MAG: dipeptidase PepE [Thermoanaerobaculia bacterium]
MSNDWPTSWQGGDGMTRLLLFSNSTNHGEGYLDSALPEMLGLLAGIGRVLFVPFALHDRAGYTTKFRSRLVEAGVEVDEATADLSGRRRVDSAEAVFVGGGNTFRLLKTLQDADLLAPLRERALAGMPYMGASAGINLAGPTIRTTNDMPIVEPRDFDALRLVPFQINPHYLDPGRLDAWAKRGSSASRVPRGDETPVVGLREGAWIRVEEGSALLGGRRGARIFRRGRAPEERAAGASLDDLC